MKNFFKLFSVVSSIILLFILLQTNTVFSSPDSTSTYVRPLCEYQEDGTTHYCCKDTQYSSCSSSKKCSDISDNNPSNVQ